METASVLLCEFRKDPFKFPANKIGQFRSVLGEMGMTPSSRAKLHVDKPKTNEFDDV